MSKNVQYHQYIYKELQMNSDTGLNMSETGDNDEEDDNHFCMRCKRIISGISNYIQHRKQKCLNNEVRNGLRPCL